MAAHHDARLSRHGKQVQDGFCEASRRIVREDWPRTLEQMEELRRP
jgi:hypothetical protein